MVRELLMWVGVIGLAVAFAAYGVSNSAVHSSQQHSLTSVAVPVVSQHK